MPSKHTLQKLVSECFVAFRRQFTSGSEKGVIMKGVFSLEESLEALKPLNSRESLGNGQILLCFPQSGGSLEVLESRYSLQSLQNGFF